MLFDRTVLRQRGDLGAADFLHAFAAREIVERLTLVSWRFDTGLLCGPQSAALEAIFSQQATAWVRAGPSALTRPDVASDVRQPFLRTFALAISLNELHLTDDPVTMLGELRGALRPDGLFLGAALCSGTLGELSEALIAAEAELSGAASLRVAPFADVRRWGDALARAGFALPVADEVRLTVRYDDVFAIAEDLKAMGLRRILATRSRAPRRLFERADALYRAAHADADGRLRATFAFAFLSGWAPDPSQQRPAKRGSASVSLAEALKELEEGGGQG